MTKSPLRGWEAFEAVEHTLSNEVGNFTFEEPLFQRIQRALTNRAQLSPLDLAVLIRHALRFQALQHPSSGQPRLWVKREVGWPTEAEWHTAGVKANTVDDKFLVEALPWTPAWLPDVGTDGVDAAAAGAQKRCNFQRVSGDPFLTKFGRAEYLSPGQRAAVRAALTTPAGATLLICLPTGEGKSLVFQAVAEFGFFDGGRSPGVTLVVTPTLTLALDQERAAQELGMADVPRAYVGGSDESNAEIAERIANGTQGLCFASPEAVCGRLRSALMEAARNLHLRAFVVDEAHLVDAWGANFRPEFQLLSGIRHDLLKAVGAGQQFRTFLLSATLTSETVTTLQKLFGPGSAGISSGFDSCAMARLRPEIDYWVAQSCSSAEQYCRVLEAVCHLPRPAILYVTEVEQAEKWRCQLTQIGFQRLACVTGKSQGEERRQAVEKWKDGSIDLVVATSAFGLGIDNPEVRAIIHACVPETLDRFYQEVGRGGRDGRASISLIVPTGRDLKTAQGLNQRRLISVERGLERWQAMFEHANREYHGDDVFTLPLDVPPGVSRQDIDMVSEENTRWNARTLALIANAGLISLQGLGAIQMSTDQEDLGTTQINAIWRPVHTIKVLNPSHLDPVVWKTIVEPERQRLKSALHENLNGMIRYLKQEECAAETLAPLYEVHSPDKKQPLIPVTKACGGCPHCRQKKRSAWQDPPLSSSPPWAGVRASNPTASLLGTDQRLVVFCPPALLSPIQSNSPSRSLKRRFHKVLSELINSGVRNLVVLPGVVLDVARLQEEVRWLFFASDCLVANQLPQGPSIVLVSPDARLESRELQKPRQPDQSRIYFLSEGFRDPVRPNGQFSDTNTGRSLRLDELQRRIL